MDVIVDSDLASDAHIGAAVVDGEAGDSALGDLDLQ